MIEIKDYTGDRSIVSVEDWLERSGVYKNETLTKDDLIKILKAYRAYVYEAECHPQVEFHGTEVNLEDL